MHSPPGERVSGFTLPDTLPVVTDLEALPGASALLTLADGSQVTVGPTDLPSLIPPTPDDAALLTGWDKGPDNSTMYRVPAALSGRVAWALGCRPTNAPRLLEVQSGPDALTFVAEQNWGCISTLTVPRWACMRLGRPHPRFAGMPVDLTITDRRKGEENEAPTRVFFFEIYPETPEGAACLAGLGLTDQVGLPDDES